MDKPGLSSFLRDFYRYFTPGERVLWCCSAGAVLTAFLLFDRRDYMTLAASLIGVTSLILDAKANPIGQALMVSSACCMAPSPSAAPITVKCSHIWA